MRLASEEISVRLPRSRLPLKPSLRAAYRLERRYGFQKIAAALQDGSLTIIADVVKECAAADLEEFGLIIRGAPLADVLQAVTGPVWQVLLAMIGNDDEQETKKDGKQMSLADYYTRLFQIGTGYLGWTPEATWNATPAEITEAYKGRLEMLSALFGSGKPDDGEPMSWSEGMNALSALGSSVA